MSDRTAGWLASLRGLLATLLELAQTRLELIGVELEQQKVDLFDALWWGALALLLVGTSLAGAVGLVLLIVQEPYRVPALAALVLACAGAGVAALVHARRRLRRVGGAFGASARELARDRGELLSAAPR